MTYSHLHTLTNFTFLTGASHPHEMMYRAAELGYSALAITDECSLAGIVKAFVAAEEVGLKLIVGSRFTLSNGMRLVVIAPDRMGYAELSGFITLARRRAPKGEYEAHFEDLRFRLQRCLVIWLADSTGSKAEEFAEQLSRAFTYRLWIGINHQLHSDEPQNFLRWKQLSDSYQISMVACGEALMHCRTRKPLQDVLAAIRHNTTLNEMGTQLLPNAEAYLKSMEQLEALYPDALLAETDVIAELCHFSMNELRYQYPQELVPQGLTPIAHLRNLIHEGKRIRWPEEPSIQVEELLKKELALIEELHYEFYFLTVHDLVRYARTKRILCQGRGSAANSVVCYCLFITEIAPGQINVLFERFISKERDEPPDIDIDFEHERREEVIQYIYEKYGRERAAIAATVITYRTRSAIRDVGKALGMDNDLVSFLSKQMSWWDTSSDLQDRLAATGVKTQQATMILFFKLVEQILGFPRHLSQHTGGFVISEGKISDLVPVENASMPDRTLIQWDKDDLESMRLLKVDVLALGMLTALRKALDYISTYDPTISSIADIPREDPATYEMLCKADSVGVFQIESRAQMSMLPRLQPRRFYDLVIEIAIVRPGPIQGDMVHPFLRRRNGQEAITYPSKAIEAVLKPTLGVPIFQEQVMRLSMVAAGFSGGEADQLRRAMTSWGKNSKLLLFEDKFKSGLLDNGYSQEFADQLFEQVKGFGGYGFPESHSASFALLCYASSWIKCHHPAAFYCALLNSQPMGFYSPSQLIQDAQRHSIQVLPVDINQSSYDSTLEQAKNHTWGVRLGFREVSSLDTNKAQLIETWRDNKAFSSIEELAHRTSLTTSDLQCLASADVLACLTGHRHKSRWIAAAIESTSPLLEDLTKTADDLFTKAPSIEKDILDDYSTLGFTLRKHPMELLRNEYPFDRCTRYGDLINLRHQGFVRVAGIVTGRQRPGTASGTLFLTLEDETGNINVIVWPGTQKTYRNVLLNSTLLLIKGTVEIAKEHTAIAVVHVIAGQLHDYSERLDSFTGQSRDFR